MNGRAWTLLLTCSTLLSFVAFAPAQTATKGTASRTRPVPIEVWVAIGYGPSTPGWQVTRFDRIQDGLDAVGDRGTVWVAAGAYPENLLLERPVRLLGADSLKTTILAGPGDAVVVGSGDVEVEGFTITRTGDRSDAGVRLNVSSSVVRNCVVASHRDGIVVDSAVDSCLIEGCSVSETTIGIRLERDSAQNVVRGNRLSANTSHDVLLSYSSSNLITGNTADSDAYYGIDLYESHDNEISGNTLMFHTKDIHLQEANGNRILQNAISGFGTTGIETYSSSDNLVQGNTIRDQYSSAGSIRYGSNNAILDNLVENNERGISISSSAAVVARNRIDDGLWVSSAAAQVTDNVLTSRGLILYGPDPAVWTGNVIERNTLDGAPIYYFEDVVGVDRLEPPADAALVIFGRCENVVVRGFTFSQGGSVQLGLCSRAVVEVNTFGIGGQGVLLTGSSDVLVANNRMTSVRSAIEASSCDSLTVEDNVIENAAAPVSFDQVNDGLIRRNRFWATEGVSLRGARTVFEENAILETNAPAALYLYFSNDSTVRRNRIRTSIFYPPAVGISVFRSDGNSLEWNDILYHRDGIFLNNSGLNTIRDNLVAGSHLEGIRLESICRENRLEGNTILGGSNGFGIESGAQNLFTGNVVADNLRGISLDDSQNEIHSNSLVNVLNAWDRDVNTWDDGSGAGNYWHDYTGSDADGDGIGDVPYAIDGGANADRFPLMTPPGSAVLYASDYRLSAGQGGTIELSLHAGMSRSGRSYVLLGSATGRDPGTPLPGGLVELPLTWDRYTDFVLANLNSPAFAAFAGQLDAFGEATARLSLPPLPAGLAGTTYYYAYALSSPWDLVSNPVPVELVD